MGPKTACLLLAVAISARVAQIQSSVMAKPGERDQIDGIVCEVYDSDYRIQYLAVQKLRNVGGYASIKALARIMLDAPPYNSHPTIGDAIYSSLRQYAVKALDQLVPELDVPRGVLAGSELPTDDQVREWDNWIASHKEQFIHLEPTEGGDVSKSDCADLDKKRRKARGLALPDADWRRPIEASRSAT
jgi:hypothetical protein